ncbi:hypothetical protein ANTRET_LOCUS9490 [Anthophora retusa]
MATWRGQDTHTVPSPLGGHRIGPVLMSSGAHGPAAATASATSFGVTESSSPETRNSALLQGRATLAPTPPPSGARVPGELSERPPSAPVPSSPAPSSPYRLLLLPAVPGPEQLPASWRPSCRPPWPSCPPAQVWG